MLIPKHHVPRILRGVSPWTRSYIVRPCFCCLPHKVAMSAEKKLKEIALWPTKIMAWYPHVCVFKGAQQSNHNWHLGRHLPRKEMTWIVDTSGSHARNCPDSNRDSAEDECWRTKGVAMAMIVTSSQERHESRTRHTQLTLQWLISK